MEKYKFTCKIKYYHPYLPPRCRKYRYEEKEEEITLSVKSVASDEAPIAFKLSDYGHVSEKLTEIRCFKKKLYKKYRRYIDGEWVVDVEAPMLNSMIHPYFSWNCEERTREYCVAGCKKEAERYIVIDGVIWERCGEPRYCVNTFGLGHNHGGTGLFVEEHYNINISNRNYFSAFDGKKAVEYANQVAARRGDTNDVGRFEEMIEVLMPECVKVKPIRQHGKGSKFINALNTITENSDSAAEAGLAAICLAFSGL